VRSLAAVQYTPMVALAPSTTETSTLDILNGFPKLHSLAREAKTSRCTEEAACKSTSRVEIRQVIYDYRIRLESLSRDPIGYVEGQIFMRLTLCHSVATQADIASARKVRMK